MPIKFIDSVEALGLQLVPSSTESDTSSDSSMSSPSSSSYDDSTTADCAPQGGTAHAAKANIDPEDLPFDPTKANDDVEVFEQYFKYVSDTATDTPCSMEWKRRWIRRAIKNCAKEVCHGCKKLIVVQYKCPNPCDP